MRLWNDFNMVPNGKKTYYHAWERHRFSSGHSLPDFALGKSLRAVLLRRILRLTGDLFGVELLIKRPPDLEEFPDDLWQPKLMAARLQELGVIASLQRNHVLSDEPKLFVYSTRVQGAMVSGQHGVGTSFFSEADALWAAVGESLDRYALGHFSPSDYIDASYRKIVLKNALDIFSLAGISPEMRKVGHGRHKMAFDEDTVFRWVKGYSLTQERSIYVPLQLVTFHDWPNDREPVLRVPVSTGNAVGRTLEDAVYKGMLEVVERDAFMITWLNRLSPSQLDLSASESPRLKQLDEIFKRYRLELKILALPTDVPCHVIMATIVDRTPQSIFFTMGMKASRDLEEAILGAVHEAQSARLMTRGSLPLPKEELPSFDEPERIDRLMRMRIWASRPDLEKELKFLWAGGRVSPKTLSEKMGVPQSGRGFDTLVSFFKGQGTEVSFVENLPTSLRDRVPLCCAYVVIPTFQPLHLLESLPYRSGNRLAEVPRRLGYTPFGEMNPFPHPFP